MSSSIQPSIVTHKIPVGKNIIKDKDKYQNINLTKISLDLSKLRVWKYEVIFGRQWW